MPEQQPPSLLRLRCNPLHEWTLCLVLMAVLSLLPARTRAEESSVKGDVLILSGGTWPQGSTTQFSNAGWHLNLRVAPQLPFLKGVVPIAALGATFFPKESGLVEDETENFIVLAEEESDRFGGALNLGLQLGSPSRRGFFRPRAGIAPGFYFLTQEVSRRLPLDVDPYYEKTLWLGRVGWKGILGADFNVTKVVSIATEYVYDQIWDVEGGRTARYQGFAVGVAIAMESDAFRSAEEAPPDEEDETDEDSE